MTLLNIKYRYLPRCLDLSIIVERMFFSLYVVTWERLSKSHGVNSMWPENTWWVTANTANSNIC